MAAARRGFGTIRRLPSGRYQASYVGPDLQRHRAHDTFTTRADAEGWLAGQRKAISAGSWRAPTEVITAEQITLAAYGADWIETRKLARRTRTEYRRLLAARIAGSPLGDRPVAAIHAAEVRRWFAAQDRKTPTRNAHAYQLLHSIMVTAVKDEIRPANPCQMDGASSTRRVREPVPPTAAELEVIVENTPPRYRAMVLIAAWCGLRFGESVALRRRDIVGDVVHVRRASVRDEGETHIGPTKNEAGQRTVTIPPHVMPAVTEHLRSFVTGRDGLLFPTPGGLVMIGGNGLNSWWHPARAAAGRRDLRWHDLRHHGATLAAQAGATLPELMQRIGHSTPQAAMRYQHATVGRDAEIARRLSVAAGG